MASPPPASKPASEPAAATPGADGASAAYTVHVRSLSAVDGTPLKGDSYVPKAGAPRGVAVVVPGYCDHRGRYRHVAAHLVAAGYQVLTCDLRGHGESAGVRGFVQRFSDYVDDLRAFVAEARRLAGAGDPKPLIVGHSMGGLAALQYVLAEPDAVRALALSAPFLGIKVKVPGWKRTLGTAASKLLPTLAMPNGIPAEHLSHDASIVEGYKTDPLVTHNATARWFTETLAAHADTLARAGRIRLPVLMQQPGDDRIVDGPAAEAVFERLGSADKNLTAYPGLFHEIFNERTADRQRVLADLTTWLETH